MFLKMVIYFFSAPKAIHQGYKLVLLLHDMVLEFFQIERLERYMLCLRRLDPPMYQQQR